MIDDGTMYDDAVFIISIIREKNTVILYYARPSEMMLLLIEFSHPQVTLNKSMASSTSALYHGLRYIRVITQIINPIEERRIAILSNRMGVLTK
jgi:hypothetical protein